MSHLFGVGLQVEVNKIQVQFRMQLAKKGGVKFLIHAFREIDVNNNNTLDPEEFERALNKIGLFPTKVQMQVLFKYYDVNGDGVVTYDEFLAALREPLRGSRLDVVQRAYAKLDRYGTGVVDAEKLFDTFCCEDSEPFKSGKATKEDIFAMCGLGEIAQTGTVSKEDFINLYTDISMSIQSSDFFVKMVEHCWDICSDSDCAHNVTTNSLVKIIRQKLLSMSNKQSDEYVLRTIFNEFDVNKDGTIGADELHQMLTKMQIRCQIHDLKDLMLQFDRNKNGLIEFEEFVHFLIHNPYK